MSPASTPASPGNSGQHSSQNKRQSTGVTCTQCNAAAKAGQHTLRCLCCGDSIHLACQYKAFKDTGKEALKNRLDWLADYILFAGLTYRCKASFEKKEVVSAESSVTMVSQVIAIVKQSIVALDTKLQLLHNAISQLQPCNDIASTDGDQPEHHQPLSYAAVVSSDVVKNAVSAAFREHQKVNVDQSCIAVYGFPDEGNDYELCWICSAI